MLGFFLPLRGVGRQEKEESQIIPTSPSFFIAIMMLLLLLM
jgi:hypothetical protein